METSQQVHKYDWEDIFTDSEYQIANKLLEVYEKGEYDEIGKALQEMLKASIRGAELDLLDELKELMENILFHKYLPEERTQERWELICRHRREIESLMEYNACLTKTTITELWESAYNWAAKILKIYLPSPIELTPLTFDEVFETEFRPYVASK